MNLTQIKAAVKAGFIVHWMNHGYTVSATASHVVYHNGDAIGLTHLDGVTLNGQERDFFMRRTDVEGLLCHVSQNAEGAHRFDVSHMYKGFVASSIVPDGAALKRLCGYNTGKPVPDYASDAEIAVMIAADMLLKNKKD